MVVCSVLDAVEGHLLQRCGTMVLEVGRVCVKIAGRDAGRSCVVVDVLDKNFVIIDGQTRRKRSNIQHLEPLTTQLPIKKGAAHEEVKDAFNKIGIEILDKRPKLPVVNSVQEKSETKNQKSEKVKK